MFRLIFIFTLLLPFTAFFVTQGVAANESVDSAVSDVFDTRIDKRLDALDACKSRALPIYFHDNIISLHSANLIHDAVQATDDCQITSVTVAVAATDDAKTLSSERATAALEHLDAADIDAPIYVRMSDMTPSRDLRNHGAIIIEISD